MGRINFSLSLAEHEKSFITSGSGYFSPLNLELTASSEAILLDNLEIFKKNGFDFIIDEEGRW